MHPRANPANPRHVLPVAPPKRGLGRPLSRAPSREHLSSVNTAATERPGSALSARRDHLSTSASSTASTEKDGASGNIQVVVRCRGVSASDAAAGVPLVASTSATRGTSVTLTQPAATTSSGNAAPAQTRQYEFDHVYGPSADQGMLYNDVVGPLLDEVLSGFNCTLFAYGNTGTGKTHTMEGDLNTYHNTFAPEAGVIPRTLFRLFHRLETTEGVKDYAVRCSFIELYQEEIRDLLASPASASASFPFENPAAPAATGRTSGAFSSMPGLSGQPGQSSSSAGLRIYDDKSAGGTGSGVVIQGLEETCLSSAEEGLRVLKRGSERRQVASTKCNDRSSRSHSIFTLTVHIKEVSSRGEDMLKVGKFNLVDLAGSENVGRSGAENARAREAGAINASLLALGRVINKLVDKQPHIPYRESKLTRLLQDSLGGRTKTCIIATIGQTNFEETASTLDYALRAKSITNKPEANQRMTKAALLSQYTAEIERLKTDLNASREKNGVYFSPASWEEHEALTESRRLALVEAEKQAEINESLARTVREQFEQNLRLLGMREEDLRVTVRKLEEEGERLAETRRELGETKGELETEQKASAILEEAKKGWEGRARTAQDDTDGLRAKIGRKDMVEDANLAVVQKTSELVDEVAVAVLHDLNALKMASLESATKASNALGTMGSELLELLSAQLGGCVEETRDELERFDKAVLEEGSEMAEVEGRLTSELRETRSQLGDAVTEKLGALRKLQRAHAEAVMAAIDDHACKITVALQEAMQPLLRLTEATQTALRQDRTGLAELAQLEKAELEGENARLKETVKHLAATLEEQRGLSASSSAATLALLAQHLEAQTEERNKKLEASIALAKAQVESGYDSRKTVAGQRGEIVRGLRKANADLDATVQKERGIALNVKTLNAAELEASAKNLAKKNTDGNAVSFEWLATHGAFLEATSARLDSAEARFREDASTSKTRLEEAVEAHAQHLRTQTDVLEQGLLKGVDGLEVLVSSLDEQFEHSSHVAAEFVESAVRSVDALQAGRVELLAQSIVRDVPTGTTPKKREWASDPSLNLEKGRSDILEMLRASAAPKEAPVGRQSILGQSVLGLKDLNREVARGADLQKSTRLRESVRLSSGVRLL